MLPNGAKLWFKAHSGHFQVPPDSKLVLAVFVVAMVPIVGTILPRYLLVPPCDGTHGSYCAGYRVSCRSASRSPGVNQATTHPANRRHILNTVCHVIPGCGPAAIGNASLPHFGGLTTAIPYGDVHSRRIRFLDSQGRSKHNQLEKSGCAS